MASKELKILVGLFVISILSMIAHNLFYALVIVLPNYKTILEVVSVIFFFLNIISALAFVLFLVYVCIKYLTKGKPKDAWKVGWIGLVMLIFLLLIGMNPLGFYIFAIFLILFFIPKIKQLVKKKKGK